MNVIRVFSTCFLKNKSSSSLVLDTYAQFYNLIISLSSWLTGMRKTFIIYYISSIFIKWLARVSDSLYDGPVSLKLKTLNKQTRSWACLDMLCSTVDFNFKFPKRTFFGAMLWDFLSWKKSSLSKAWPVLDSCKHNSYILPRENDPAHVLLIPHTPLPLPGVAPPKLTF